MTAVEAFISATKFRAKAYYYLYEEMVSELGSEKAIVIFTKATYRLGVDKADSFSDNAGISPEELAKEFVKDDIGREVFDQSVIKVDGNMATVEMKRCPLVEMWKEMNLSDEMIEKLCDVAHRIDFGTVEGKGFKLKFSSKISCGDGSCILEISK